LLSHEGFRKQLLRRKWQTLLRHLECPEGELFDTRRSALWARLLSVQRRPWTVENPIIAVYGDQTPKLYIETGNFAQ